MVKRLLRHRLDKAGLDLANPHEPGEATKMEGALHVLRRIFADAGYDPR